ncbi:transcription termination/antitermination protein NusG [Ensifer sp. MJa1]|uniref:transcription termination/antitermination protein NusG n=1 Tax=Ensifer sp. MJa1 TaxID=2919888 RepID=UPI0030083614
MLTEDAHNGSFSGQPHDGQLERWYVVQTHQHCENLAERHLSLQNFRTYLPKRRRTVRHARRITTQCAAYFDGYLFVSLDIHRQRWSPINSTVGVRKLVMSDRKPIPVPYGVVESLILATDEEGFLHPNNIFQAGKTIKVSIGPFMDQLGTLEYVCRSGAVRVLMYIMNRAVPIYIDRDKCLVLD